VTVVDHGDVLVDGLPEADTVLLSGLRERGVRVLQEARVQEVARDRDGVAATLADGEVLQAARLVVATGTRPRVSGIGLESLGITPAQFAVDRTGRVRGAPRTWAVGDVTGFPAFTHTANHVGAVVGANILGGDRRADLAHTPRGIFTDPPVVLVGELTPADGCVRVTVSFDDGARPVTDRTGPGVLALQARSDGVVLGVGGIGATVDELASAWTIIVALELSVHDLAAVQQQFPTHGELTKLLAERASAALR
jgi:dihydrolipoamide dehydrogenase